MNKNYLKKLKNEQLKLLEYFVSFCDQYNLNYVLIGGTLLGAVRHKGYIPWDDDIDIAMPRKDYEMFLKLFKETNDIILDYSVTNSKYWLPFAKIRNNKTEYIENLQENYNGPKGIWIDIFPLDDVKKEKGVLEYMQFRLVRFLRHAISYKVNIRISESHLYSKILATLFSFLPYRFLVWLNNKIMTLNDNKNLKYCAMFGSTYGYKAQIFLKEKILPVKKMIFEGKIYSVPNDSDYILTKTYGSDYMKLPPKEKRVTHNPIKVKFSDGKEMYFNDNK